MLFTPMLCAFHSVVTPSHSKTFNEEKGKNGCNRIAGFAIRYAQLLIVFLHSSGASALVFHGFFAS